MSRHRNVRWMSTDDYDDDYYDDDDYDYDDDDQQYYSANGPQEVDAWGQPIYSDDGYYDNQEQYDPYEQDYYPQDNEEQQPEQSVDQTPQDQEPDPEFEKMMVNELESRFADFDMIPGRADMTNALRNTEYDVDSAFQLILEQQKPKKPLVLDTTPKKPKKAIEIGTPSPSSGSKNSTSSSNNKGKTTAGSTNDKKGKGTPSSSSSKPRIQQAAKRSKAVQKAIAEYAEDKARVNMVVVGHVDAGKSTMMGHLLYQIGSVAKQDLRKFEKESKQIGKGSFHFAWVMDNEDEERERGVTIDVGVRSFETDSKEITLLDAPGHRDFIPNMINGASQADVAILVVNAAEGEFESGFHDGGQTKEHAMLVRSLGVSDLVVAVNKMDIVDWSQERYLSIVAEVSEFLKSSGFKDEVDFVPVSGFTGENLVANTADALKEWYDGPTLLERIDKFSPPLRPLDIPLRMPISDLYKGSGNTVVVIGRVESG
eukprot:TRINITY_DN2156_c0_g1_i2.p1 TRINITY_DN2156_c0_g1~~TRINITY_DN2156_c0_g1_i2.p1  ORF type:complete len:483 (+),score=168.05 TRINITY_DN2156_c0_g1_i2:1019-2467(+)